MKFIYLFFGYDNVYFNDSAGKCNDLFSSMKKASSLLHVFSNQLTFCANAKGDHRIKGLKYLKHTTLFNLMRERFE